MEGLGLASLALGNRSLAGVGNGSLGEKCRKVRDRFLFQVEQESVVAFRGAGRPEGACFVSLPDLPAGWLAVEVGHELRVGSAATTGQ